jgi:hypothetical protein
MEVARCRVNSWRCRRDGKLRAASTWSLCLLRGRVRAADTGDDRVIMPWHGLALLSLSLLLCHPKAEAAHLVIIDELNSGLLERCLNPDQCQNIAGNWPMAFFYALNRGRPDPGGLRLILLIGSRHQKKRLPLRPKSSHPLNSGQSIKLPLASPARSPPAHRSARLAHIPSVVRAAHFCVSSVSIACALDARSLVRAQDVSALIETHCCGRCCRC